MNTASIFSDIEQQELTYEGQVFKAPFFIRDANVMGAFFLCDYVEAQALTGPSFKPVRLPFGKAIFAIHSIEYHDTDIGSYNEVALAIVVQRPGTGLLQRARSLHSLLKAQFHAYIFELPVTTKLSVAGGKGLLRYPKHLADITVRDTGSHRICTWRDKDTLDIVLELECPKLKTSRGGLRVIQPRMSVATYVAGCDTSNATFKMHLPEVRQSMLWPRVSLRLGKSEIAQKLSRLGIGAQLYQLSVPHCEGILEKT